MLYSNKLNKLVTLYTMHASDEVFIYIRFFPYKCDTSMSHAVNSTTFIDTDIIEIEKYMYTDECKFKTVDNIITDFIHILDLTEVDIELICEMDMVK